MAFLEKGILLYLTITIACVFWQPQIILNNDFGDVNMLSWFGVEYNESDDSVIVPDSINELQNEELMIQTQTGNETESGFFKRGFDFSTSLFQFIVDGLANVLGVLQVLFQILFAPFFIFYYIVSQGAPLPILFIFGIPLVIMLFAGIITYIRGAN